MNKQNMGSQGLEAMYTQLDPVKTIRRLVNDTTFRSSNKVTAVSLHDNLIRLRNWTRWIFVNGLSEFEASSQKLAQVLCEHVEEIGNSLRDIETAIHNGDTSAIEYVPGSLLFNYIELRSLGRNHVLVLLPVAFIIPGWLMWHTEAL